MFIKEVIFQNELHPTKRVVIFRNLITEKSHIRVVADGDLIEVFNLHKISVQVIEQLAIFLGDTPAKLALALLTIWPE